MSETPGKRGRPTIGSLLRQGAPPWAPDEQQAAWSRLQGKMAPASRWRRPGPRRLALMAVAGMAVVALWFAVRGGRGGGEARVAHAPAEPALAYQVEEDTGEHGTR